MVESMVVMVYERTVEKVLVVTVVIAEIFVRVVQWSYWGWDGCRYSGTVVDGVTVETPGFRWYGYRRGCIKVLVCRGRVCENAVYSVVLTSQGRE